ncbi:hypothetical protein J8273_7040 [Carpediemonas membranifera]|uniref:Uncharacterized protein n=1 Tax=Carpediemonas membranifera TaxID=201153 RepID=A0A8J6E1L5_9EUKA|nr:hypothetical protein J8273_7040 [Carpediemonas membranifera]|eukprot:KAG9390787.1 hypothetical protein J8273_7040 [Carpediemonas membranifera]
MPVHAHSVWLGEVDLATAWRRRDDESMQASNASYAPLSPGYAALMIQRWWREFGIAPPALSDVGKDTFVVYPFTTHAIDPHFTMRRSMLSVQSMGHFKAHSVLHPLNEPLTLYLQAVKPRLEAALEGTSSFIEMFGTAHRLDAFLNEGGVMEHLVLDSLIFIPTLSLVALVPGAGWVDILPMSSPTDLSVPEEAARHSMRTVADMGSILCAARLHPALQEASAIVYAQLTVAGSTVTMVTFPTASPEWAPPAERGRGHTNEVAPLVQAVSAKARPYGSALARAVGELTRDHEVRVHVMCLDPSRLVRESRRSLIYYRALLERNVRKRRPGATLSSAVSSPASFVPAASLVRSDQGAEPGDKAGKSEPEPEPDRIDTNDTIPRVSSLVMSVMEQSGSLVEAEPFERERGVLLGVAAISAARELADTGVEGPHGRLLMHCAGLDVDPEIIAQSADPADLVIQADLTGGFSARSLPSLSRIIGEVAVGPSPPQILALLDQLATLVAGLSRPTSVLAGAVVDFLGLEDEYVPEEEESSAVPEIINESPANAQVCEAKDQARTRAARLWAVAGVSGVVGLVAVALALVLALGLDR